MGYMYCTAGGSPHPHPHPQTSLVWLRPGLRPSTGLRYDPSEVGLCHGQLNLEHIQQGRGWDLG